MKVVLTGANGAVGRVILLGAPSHGALDVVAAVRSERAVAELRSVVATAPGVAHVSYDDVARLAATFDGAAAVIHLAGVLVERRDSSYEEAAAGSSGST